jgi:hypothetical protein
MSARPQSAYPPAPEGWEDIEFEYFFDVSNTPAFQTTLLPGEAINDIVLQLQRDAQFRWRAIQVSNPGSPLALRFQLPDGTEMQADFAPMEDFSGFPGAQGGIPGGAPVAIEPEVVCAPGSVILVSALNTV